MFVHWVDIWCGNGTYHGTAKSRTPLCQLYYEPTIRSHNWIPSLPAGGGGAAPLLRFDETVDGRPGSGNSIAGGLFQAGLFLANETIAPHVQRFVELLPEQKPQIGLSCSLDGAEHDKPLSESDVQGFFNDALKTDPLSILELLASVIPKQKQSEQKGQGAVLHRVQRSLVST